MDVIAERYELLEVLGEGGMARVHAARDIVLDRRVAMKLLRSDIGRDEILRERFLQESRLAARLNHANIVRVYDAGVQQDTPWMAMELVEGSSLRSEMTQTGQMPAQRAVEVATQILAGLAAAHDAGVIHRDVKPANVLMGPDGVRLGDFGIAKALQGGGDLTRTNQFMGTPKYTAPEVAMGMPASVRSDLYAAAVVLWEMLAGEPPFEHDNPLTLAMMHRTDPLPALAELRPDLGSALITAVEAALAKEPADRPADAQAFADLLAAGLKGDTVAVAAGIAPTMALPRIPAQSQPPPPVVRQQTAVLPRPVPPPRSRAPSSARSAPPQRGVAWGLAAVVLLLLAIAAVSFMLTQSDPTDPAVTPSDAPTLPTPTAPVAIPGSSTPIAPAPPSVATPPAAPDPVTTPTAPAPAPTAATPTPVPEPTPQPEPTAAQSPLIQVLPPNDPPASP
ncbi:MAG: protein kinase domain-containing protein [Euzebya sp.]